MAKFASHKKNNLYCNIVFFLLQLTVESGEIEIKFSLLGYYNRIKYFGIDDVSLKPGECPPLGKLKQRFFYEIY